MSKACMNVSDFIGTMYDGCRITKGKDILFLVILMNYKIFLSITLVLLILINNQLTKVIMKVFYLNHLKLKSILTQIVNGSVKILIT